MRYRAFAVLLLSMGVFAKVVWASDSQTQETPPPLIEVPATQTLPQTEAAAVGCNSCAARKQRLQRLRPADATPAPSE